MKITRLQAYAIDTPITDWAFVKVETDEGIHGWGECSLPGKSQGVLGAIADLERLLLGYDPLATEQCWQRMYRHSYWRGGPILTSAISGIDCALWDIKGKALQQPIFRLLGGPARERATLYANCGISDQPVELVERMQAAIEQGYRFVKFYPLPDVEPVDPAMNLHKVVSIAESAAATVGDRGGFAIDLHGRYHAKPACQIEAAVRPCRPIWIEEPSAPESPLDLRICRDRFETRIAVGERLFTRWAFRSVFEEQLADVVQPDASNAGGISELNRIADMAELYGVDFNPHNPNGPLQSLASLHLAFAKPAFRMLEHRPEALDVHAQFCSQVVACSADGTARQPGGHGLGAEIDEDFLAGHPARSWTPETFRADGTVDNW